MSRADAANACVQSDSIKGLAQSIAKPAYHRLLIAEPALRRAVPTLIIAFLITICLGAFVQVVDQTRQKRLVIRHDLSALADLLAERIDRLTSGRQERLKNIENLPTLLPDLIPSWGTAPGRHVVVTSAGVDGRILARIPIDSDPSGNDRLLDAITTAQLLAAPPRDNNVSDMTLPNGNAAMATSRQISWRRSFGVSLSRSRPWNSMASALTLPGASMRPISASMVTDLPEPDSPTMPRSSPGSRVRSMPSTAGKVPKWTLRFLMWRRLIAALVCWRGPCREFAPAGDLLSERPESRQRVAPEPPGPLLRSGLPCGARTSSPRAELAPLRSAQTSVASQFLKFASRTGLKSCAPRRAQRGGEGTAGASRLAGLAVGCSAVWGLPF